MKFSVSMSVYKNDHPEHFREAVESIINQTVKPDEIVLVVDGPVSDEIEAVIQVFDNNVSYFKTIRLSQNRGHAIARQTGIENTRNELIAIMDSDDRSIETRFEKQLNILLKDSSISVVGGQIEEFDDELDTIVGQRIVPLEDASIKKYMKSRCPMNQVTVMFRKSDVLEVGGYIDWHHNEDYYLWIRMAIAKKKFMNLEDVLVKVRVNKNVYARRGGWHYFNSERKIQQLMFSENLINRYRLISNISIRFLVQLVMPHTLRRHIFAKLFRN